MEKQPQNQLEFITLMAALMASVALSLDALLPALDLIGKAVGNTDPVKNQWLVTIFFLGVGTGPLVFGPISDSIGRKPVVYIGFALFVAASVLCVKSSSLGWMIFGRYLQGAALSAPRTVSIAMIRDKFSGDFMARIMSFVTAIFILIPVVAPALGKTILDTFGWKAIFHFQVVFGIAVAIWFWLRQPETLSVRNRKTFRPIVLWTGFREVLQFRRTVIFTLIWGLITGSFLVYLSTTQVIFEIQYGVEDLFPYLFAALAITIGGATLVNGSLVIKYGMQRLIGASLVAFTLIACFYLLLFYGQENPSIPILMLFLCLQFFAVGFLFGNLRAMAMEPLGHIAGLGAAITGFLATVISVALSAWIGSFLHDTVIPLFAGFLVCGVLSLLLFAFSLFRSKTSMA
ncbi:MAG: multidrug effflux MFS transporter [Robiginitalea sp.]|uniref:multidrug effflux MFS transporter n=1 Tax=Robiginitalea sp. TaxID=1902411 RepID=UPI003C72508A